MIWLALHLGRSFTRLLLYPIVGYFLLTGGAPARASRGFLRQVLGREPRWHERMRHWHTFAAVVLDRVFLLADRSAAFAIGVEGQELVLDALREGRGAVLLVSHFGSFEVLRSLSQRQPEVTLRIVADRQHGAMLTQLLEALNPALAAGVIDTSQRGPALALALKAALDEGHVLGLMADRAYAGERTVPVGFMDRTARLPENPWILAGVLHAPVLAGFGIYRGANRYQVRFELLAARVVLGRANRSEAIRGYAQQYATCLEAQVRAAPYNWFNFFEFWSDEATAD